MGGTQCYGDEKINKIPQETRFNNLMSKSVIGNKINK